MIAHRGRRHSKVVLQPGADECVSIDDEEHGAQARLLRARGIEAREVETSPETLLDDLLRRADLLALAFARRRIAVADRSLLQRNVERFEDLRRALRTGLVALLSSVPRSRTKRIGRAVAKLFDRGMVGQHVAREQLLHALHARPLAVGKEPQRRGCALQRLAVARHDHFDEALRGFVELHEHARVERELWPLDPSLGAWRERRDLPLAVRDRLRGDGTQHADANDHRRQRRVALVVDRHGTDDRCAGAAHRIADDFATLDDDANLRGA